MKKFFKRVLPIITITALCLSLVACGNGNAVPTAAISNSILVDTITPEIGNIVVVGEYIGTMEPHQQVTVFPRVPGEVQAVYFSVGDTVEAGDVLFTIDAVDIINNITSLEAQLAAQDAAVRAAQTGVNLVDGSAMQSQMLSAAGGVSQAEVNLEQSLLAIEQAQAAYDVASQGYRDTAALFEAGVATRVALDQAEMNYINAQAGLERAQSGYNMATLALSQALEGQRILLEQTPAENRIRAQDGLAQAQAVRNTTAVGLQTARDRLDDAVVRAPISGVIERRSVEPFNIATPQAPAFVIAAQDSMNVSFRVPRGSATYLALGDTVTLNVANTDYLGTITEIATMVDAGGLLAIKANIPNPPDGIFSGSSVRIFADVQRALNVPIVPLSAIHYDRGVPYMFIAEDGFARRVQVEVGIFDAHNIQIISGINTTDQIISTWSARLADGVEIEMGA